MLEPEKAEEAKREKAVYCAPQRKLRMKRLPKREGWSRVKVLQTRNPRVVKEKPKKYDQ